MGNCELGTRIMNYDKLNDVDTTIEIIKVLKAEIMRLQEVNKKLEVELAFKNAEITYLNYALENRTKN